MTSSCSTATATATGSSSPGTDRTRGGRLPATIAVGDFDGDGLPDLALGLQNPSDVAVELNLGGGVFGDAGSIVLAPHNTPLVADLNGDGVPDITVVDGPATSCSGAGKAGEPGVFDPPITLNPGDPSRDITAIPTGQGSCWPARMSTIMRSRCSHTATNNGSGRPTSRPACLPRRSCRPTSPSTASMTWVVRNAGDGTLTIYPNDGHGGFLPRIDIQVGLGISDVAVYGLDPGGLPDLIVTNEVTGQVEVLVNQRGGSFGPPSSYRAGGGLSGVTDDTRGPPASPAWKGPRGSSSATVARGSPDARDDESRVRRPSGTGGPGGWAVREPGRDPDAGPVSMPVSSTSKPAATSTWRPRPQRCDGLPRRWQRWVRHPVTYPAGLDPTGLTIADVGATGFPT